LRAGARGGARNPWLWRRLALAASVSALVVLAFLAGRWSDGPERGPIAPEARDRILLVAVGDHLDRSRRLLIELANAEASAVADLSSQQALAHDLASNNRLYRKTAGVSGREEVVELLEELEAVLLEVANGPAQRPYADLQSLKQRIATRGLVMRVRLLGDRARVGAVGRPRRRAWAGTENQDL
jgi:hypothetical protein